MVVVTRLGWHTLVAIVLASAGIVAPIALLLPLPIFGVSSIVGLILLATGCASLIGAVVSRCIPRTSCTPLQWRSMMITVWLLNPVILVIVGTKMNYPQLVCWSALPLGLGLTLLSIRLVLIEGDLEWPQGRCPFSAHLCVQRICSRLIVMGVPACLLSFQVVLYLPAESMLPQAPAENSVFVCGGCILISVKFCAMCACLAQSQIAQVLVLFILLSADWFSSLHLLHFIEDGTKVLMLEVHLLAAGVVQLYAALRRLKLGARWRRALLHRHASDTDGVAPGNTELGMHINLDGHESSDSDDDRGPGSVPDGFHEALVVLLGVPPARSQNARRQFLCGPRSAVVVQRCAGASADTEATNSAPKVDSGSIPLAVMTPSNAEPTEISLPNAAAPSPTPGGSSGVLPLELGAEERCVFCMEEFRTGDKVRPLPKCSHIFHAGCLERWAKEKREATQCPTCRRPALARRPGDGTTSISALSASSEDLERAESTQSLRSSASGSTAGSSERPPSNRPARQIHVQRRVQSGSSARTVQSRPSRRTGNPATMSASLGISETMVQAALEASGGAMEVAGDLLFEHAALLTSSFSTPPVVVAVPTGVVEAIVEANPNLAGLEEQLQRQLGRLYHSSRLQAMAWTELTPEGKAELFRVLLEDVVRGLNQRR